VSVQDIVNITGTGRKCICLSDSSCVNTRSESQILKYFMTSVHCYVVGESQWRSCTCKHCSSVGCPVTEWRSAECVSVCQQSQRFWHSQQQQTKQHPAAGTLSLKSCYCTYIYFFLLVFVSHYVLLLVTLFQVLLPMSAAIFTIIFFPFCIFITFFHLSLSVPILPLHLIFHLCLLIFIFTFCCFAFFILFLSSPPPH
jgi:hypothetical protein